MPSLLHMPIFRAIDFQASAAQFRGAEPFPHICFDDFLTPEAATAIEQAFPSFEEAQRLGQGFRAVNERGKYQVTNSELFPEAIKVLHEELQSPAFIEKLRALSGYDDLVGDAELVGGGMHQTGPRGHLDVHIDFNYIKHRRLHRRLNILLFFNRDWQEAWGGLTELWDVDVKRLAHSFLPIYNRCVIFETSEISWHGVTAVTCPPDRSRKSFAGYYYTPCTEEEIEANGHGTIFKARPTERSKRYVKMPMQNVQRWLRRKINVGIKGIRGK